MRWSCGEKPGECRNPHGCHCREIEQLCEIRELLIKSVMKATGASRTAVEEAPFTCACDHRKQLAMAKTR